MSVLELLDTITGAYNNWVDGIKNDDPTFIGQIKGDLFRNTVTPISRPVVKCRRASFWQRELPNLFSRYSPATYF